MHIRQRIGIIFAIVAILLIGVVVFIIWPTITDIRQISQSVYLERVDLEKKYLRGQLLRKTIEDFEKIKPERDRLNTIFLLTGDELSFITTLEQIAHNRQLAEHKIDLQPARSGFFPLRLTLSGTFEQVMGYVSDIESLSQYYIIDNLSVATSRIENGTEPAAIRLNLSGKIYSREPEKL
ncbi:MAG: hypothetical protein A2840_00095 [Candidatus Buchananbacteria bacterium RIFCSPHIGHO2_01_FULL_47_11b]|uniref:Type 4a pilus biogenesis protein PilO n=1 Tax=Candidatus Buchananbacteria bacterium RIFCSPHIGHO2_01_FULL_47_11b TaxID=1797537 RepID=A0A1G1Y5S7_9BACT|nr:MAG: hypothetical protein A2840_00095 [Candidatus Buchananbacteria bacterium RIFCSPHIGHO2_01_FULL_47_11b]